MEYTQTKRQIISLTGIIIMDVKITQNVLSKKRRTF